MVKKTKRKITILLYVIFMTAFFTVLFIFYAAHKESNKSEIESQLAHYTRNIRLVRSYQEKGTMVITSTALINDDEISQLSEIYTVRNDNGHLTVLKDENERKLSENEILQIAADILEQKPWKGTLGHYQYKRCKKGREKLIVFTDVSFFEHQQKQMLLLLCGISVITAVVWAIVSIGISGWLVKPLETALEKQNEFISAAGHELKTPLSVMKASLEMLKTQIDQNKYLDYVITENEKMDDLIQEMLSLSKLEFQQEVVEMEVINVSTCIEGSALPFEVMAYEKGICLEMQIEKDLFIYGSEKDIQQLTGILLDNAVRHTIPKGKTILMLERKKDKAVFIVRNQGNEIPEEEREKIFEQFYRCDKARNRGEGRYGLGLSIARNIARLYRTEIQLECENGWTNFFVKFELVKNR